MPTITRNDQKTIGAGGRSSRGHSFNPRTVPFERVGQDEAAEIRHLERPSRDLGLLIGPADDDERRSRLRLPMALHGGELGRLMVKGVETVQVADDDL